MGPRYPVRSRFKDRLQFLGSAGPVDVWFDDPGDAFPYLTVMGDEYSSCSWDADAEEVIRSARRFGLHLTLHDECIIHQMVAAATSANAEPGVMRRA